MSLPFARTWPKKAPAILLAMPFATAIAIGAPPGHAAAAVPPGYSTTVTGNVHDFDYFMGSGWVTHQHKLKARGVGSTDWEDFSGILCARPYLNGMATVDELYFPTKGSSGLTLRTYDPTRRQWSIYWVSSTTGKLDDAPMVGGFRGKLGEFYAEDRDAQGRPIKVRFFWKILDHEHARWEQAFSYDNRTWETNWTANFTRADRATVCKGGRPKAHQVPVASPSPQAANG